MKYIYVDGSCRGKNQRGAENIGGHSMIVFVNDTTLDIFCATEKNTTNNRQELKGLLKAMEYAKLNFKEKFTIICDSAYCVKMCNEWINAWAENGWKNRNSKPVENLDLVKPIYHNLSGFINFSIMQTKGHAGELGNELADLAAKDDIVSLMKLVNDSGLIIRNYVNEGSEE